MRDKHRYFLVESTTEVSGDEQTYMNNLSKELMRCIGETKYHRVNPKLMKFVDKNTFIIKTNLIGASDLVLALTLTKRINNSDTAFYTLRSSGTIKALLSSRA